VVLPTNAHIDFSGDSWSCDVGYERKSKDCVLRD
jgi:hypothetical protein